MKEPGKFQGNQHTLKTVMKNTLEKEGCLDEKEVVPMVPIANIYVYAVAGRKLVYREEEKRKSICLEVCDDDNDDISPRDVYAVQGNYVIDLNSFSSILREVAMCFTCEVGSLELFESGKKEFCATFLILRAILVTILDLSGVLVVRLVSHMSRSVLLRSE